MKLEKILNVIALISILFAIGVVLTVVDKGYGEQTSTLIFTWDPNTETKLVGYRIYWSTTDGGPYVKYSENENSPNFIDSIPAGTETYTQQVPVGTYYWVLTAYTNEHESDFSNQVTKTITKKDLGRIIYIDLDSGFRETN